jgi:hypothetical protein
VAASDTSTSIVITPNGPQSQIQCGKTAIQTYSDVVYSTPRSAGKQVDLKLDVQVPKTAGRSHWSSTSRGRVRLVDKTSMAPNVAFGASNAPNATLRTAQSGQRLRRELALQPVVCLKFRQSFLFGSSMFDL